jgi:hypothetical protein
LFWYTFQKMKDESNELAPPEASALVRREHAVELSSGRRIEAAEVEGGGELVRIRAKDGTCMLTVELTDKGPILRFEGAALEIVAPKSLDIACGTLNIEAKETARITGKKVEIEAKKGSIEVVASDDVRVEGERVLLNSTDPPLPVSWEEFAERQKAKQKLEGTASVELLPRGVKGQRDS